MKKIIYLLLFVLLLTSCNKAKIPELVNSYDTLDLKTEEVEVENNRYHKVDEKYGYCLERTEIYKLYVYKNNDIIETLEANTIYVKQANIVDDKLYLVITLLNNNYLSKIICFDESTVEIIFESTKDINEVIYTSSIHILTTNKIIILNDDKTINKEIRLESELYSFKITKDGYIGYGIRDFYLITDEGQESLYHFDDIIEVIDYNYDSELYFKVYDIIYENFNPQTIKIYEYNKNKLSLIYEIIIPNDYSYYLCSVISYNNSIYLLIHINEKDKPKSLFSRYVILGCNEVGVKCFYIDNNYSTYFIELGCIYLGEDSLFNNQNFIKISLS